MSEIPYKFHKVADIADVADSEKVAGAIFFDDATECVYVYGADGTPVIYGSQKWVWSELDYTTFVNKVGVGDILQYTDTEVMIVANKKIENTATSNVKNIVVTLVAPRGFYSVKFNTTDSGTTWSLVSFIQEDFSDFDGFVKTTDVVSNAATANTVVGRDNDGDVWVRGIVDSHGQSYALPHSDFAESSDADYVLQEKITDISDIRSNAAKGATAVQKSGDTMTGNLTVPAVIGNLEGTADYAKELTGHIEPTEEEFNFRASAGDKSIRDESAVIRSIKGNSLVWGQHFDFENGSVEFHLCTGVKTNGVYTVTIPSTNTNNRVFSLPYTIPFNQHIWLAIATVKSDTAVNIAGMYTQGFALNTKCVISAVYVATDNRNWRWGLTVAQLETEGTVEVYDYQLFDLTQMFGAGNEPTTVEEFYQRIPVGVDLSAYNAGEIIDLAPESIKTTGFNQWDEQWELGMFDNSTGEQAISYENIRNANPIRVLPSTTYYEKQPSADNLLMVVLEYTQDGTYIGRQYIYNKTFATSPNTSYVNFYMSKVYGTVYNNDICINLSHTGYRNGEYEAYKEFTHDLSWVKKYFPNGMRSAGTARDEIRFNSSTQKWEAVQNVDVRTFAEGDDTDTTVTTDGNNTNYALATPIVTEITDVVDMTYNVYDFGTEELLVADGDKSSPFSGEVVYQFNAVDRIRDAERNINVLKEEVAGKQDTIADLDTIRDGATLGATAVQPNGTSSQFVKGNGSLDSTEYLPLTGGELTGTLYTESIAPATIPNGTNVSEATIGHGSGRYAAMYATRFVGTADKATSDASGNNIADTYATKDEIPTVPTKTSELTNDSGFATVKTWLYEEWTSNAQAFFAKAKVGDKIYMSDGSPILGMITSTYNVTPAAGVCIYVAWDWYYYQLMLTASGTIQKAVFNFTFASASEV